MASVLNRSRALRTLSSLQLRAEVAVEVAGALEVLVVVLWLLAGQLVTPGGHEVNVKVLVSRAVEVTTPPTLLVEVIVAVTMRLLTGELLAAMLLARRFVALGLLVGRATTAELVAAVASEASKQVQALETCAGLY